MMRKTTTSPPPTYATRHPTPDAVRMTSPHRAAFSLPDDLHYLNCAYMAPLPRRSEEAGIEGIRRKGNPALIGPEAFFDEADAVRGTFARILGSDQPDRIALFPSVSYGVATAAKNARLEAGQEVILTRDQFPGNVYGWTRAAAEAGATVRFVDPSPDSRTPGTRGRSWNERILEAIGPRTRVVSLGHVHWTDGTLFRLEEIGARARQVGALLVIDGTQSVGALPFDLAAIRPDAVLCAGYKWLLGPYSTALAWMGPAFDDGVPLEETWIAREGSRDFGGLVNYRDSYDPGSVRYDVGERSNFVLLPMLLESLRLVLEWDPGRVASHVARISAPLLEWARDQGWGVEEEAWRAPHLFGLRLPQGAEPRAVQEALAARKVVVSVRGDALRVSPYLYNDENDLEVLKEVLATAV
jgi:selenocysteine lyase/cysteine desulfurase